MTVKMTTKDLRVPVPLYRHAAPSAPWPWVDLRWDTTELLGEATPKDEHGDEKVKREWWHYPQSLFGNWTPDQVKKSKMFAAAGNGDAGEGKEGCVVYGVDMFRDGTLRIEEDFEEVKNEDSQQAFWMRLGESRETSVRLRALFVERMSGPVLQMMGTRYNVEPFFFASSANWIPSRYQEDAQPSKGDHITIVFPFVRVNRTGFVTGGLIDTRLPLHLTGNIVLLQDLFAVHMVRTTTSDTIISYHPDSLLRQGSAARLRSLLRRTGDSVYWSKLYNECDDPTIVLLALIWHAVYAWDEALEVLYDFINKTLEAGELSAEHDVHTRELYKVRAYLICYKQLLLDFRASVAFVRATRNPAMDATSVSVHRRERAAEILRAEADHLLAEIERLEKQRMIQTDRVSNAMSLALSTEKNNDTKARHKLTVETKRDAAIIKQISYFTLVFLPPYFMAGVFRMNVKEVNPKVTRTMADYVLGTVIFTLCTAWLVIALQDPSSFHPGGRNVLRRLAWPAFYACTTVRDWTRRGWRSKNAPK